MDESCVYKKVSGSWVIFLILYVDDILLIRNDITLLYWVKIWLSKNFFMKDMKETTYILGIKFYRDISKMLLVLFKFMFIDKMKKQFSMKEPKRWYLPILHIIYLSKDMCYMTQIERDKMKMIPYALTIGSIMYAILYTRPNVSYALSLMSRYQSNPGENNWKIVKNILKYLRRTKNVFPVYKRHKLEVHGYSYAIFQSDIDDKKSQSWYIFILNGGSKQETTINSTTNVNYTSIFEGIKKVVWIKKFIIELDVVPSIVDPTCTIITMEPLHKTKTKVSLKI